MTYNTKNNLFVSICDLDFSNSFNWGVCVGANKDNRNYKFESNQVALGSKITLIYK